ncbi:MAG: hypothetical protein IK005_03005 [Paludibacteraceae bacterium]|nr:hypothetical protein [Paludibacteraceae bacterium]
MDSTDFYSQKRTGDYVIYKNKMRRESGTLLKSKNIGYSYFYDSLGHVDSVYHYILFHKDSICMGYWGENSDYDDTENKMSYVNQVWVFKKGERHDIDSANSTFYRSYLKEDTVNYGDSVFLYTQLPCVFYNDKQDSLCYLFSYTVPEFNGKEKIQKRATPYSVFKYKPKQKGKIEIRFSITELNYTKSQNISYFGYENVVVK